MKKFLLALSLCLFSSLASAQQVSTPSIVALACAYNSGTQTGTSGQFMYVQCDVNGKLLTSGGGGATAVTAAAILTANQLVVGDDGIRGIKTANTTITGTYTFAGPTTFGVITNATSLALGGATIGSNALAVTGQITTGGATRAYGNGAVIAGTNGYTVTSGANDIEFLGIGGLKLGSTDSIAFWSGTNLLTGSADLFLLRDAANILAQRNGTTAQKLSIYNTFTDASNYERGVVDWITTANTLSIGTAAAGTGTLRNIILIGGTVAIANTTDASASSASGSLQVAGGASVAKRFWIPAITASAGLQTAVLCQSSGGEMIADSVACLASSERAKEDIQPSDMGLNVIMALKPVTYRYRLTGNDRFDNAPNQRTVHAGFSAEQAASIDSRLVAYDADGNVRTMRPDAVPAALVLAVQELTAKVNALQAIR